MRSTTVFLTALVALTEAASVQKCAGSCVIQGIQASGCSSVDSHCICASDDFHSTVADCVPKECQTDDHESALSFAQDFCNKIDLVKREALPVVKREAAPEPEAEAAPQWSYGGQQGGDDHSQGGWGWGGWGWGNGGWGDWWNWWKNHPEQHGKPQHGHHKHHTVVVGPTNTGKPNHHHPHPTHKPAPTHVSPHPKPTGTVIPPWGPPGYGGNGGNGGWGGHGGHGGGSPSGPTNNNGNGHGWGGWPGWGGQHGWGGGHGGWKQ